MKAVITMKLVRPTRFNRTIIKQTITAKKDCLTDVVNDFICERVNKDNFIPVSEFTVEIFNYRNRCIDQWNYKPSYN